MSFLNVSLAAESTEFNKRIQACLFKLAGDVLNEDPTTDSHDARVQMAGNIRRYLSFDTPRFAWLAASNSTIEATISVDADGKVTVGSPDGDLEFVCSSFWTEIATQIYGSPR